MSSQDCSVCTENYTESVRSKISCGHCSYTACKPCVTRYLLSQVSDAHCMNCRTGWNHEFLDLNFSKSFCTGVWRDHKKTLLMNREKALLPNFQKYAAAKKKILELTPEFNKAKEEYEIKEHEKQMLIAKINKQKNEIGFNMIKSDNPIYINHFEDISKLTDLYKQESEKYIAYYITNVRLTRYYNSYNDNAKNEAEKKEFIMKCVKDGCRGFLSQSYKCELCSTYVCKDCMIPKKEKNDVAHTCNKEDIETVSLIRKETRPCPKCGIRISKIDGCDQMWCTSDGCGTAFSWNSGKIISGIIHNPHYYEWLRRNGNGEIPRNPGDNPCGGLPDYTSFAASLRILGLGGQIFARATSISKYVNLIYSIHRCFIDIQDYRLGLYVTARDQDFFKETHVNYLLGKSTEKQWAHCIFMKEYNIEKRQAVHSVLQTFLNAGADIFRKIVQELLNLVKEKALNPKYTVDTNNFKDVITTIEQMESLRSYINESLVKTGEVMSTPVPQFDDNWSWKPVASVKNIKNPPKVEGTN